MLHCSCRSCRQQCAISIRQQHVSLRILFVSKLRSTDSHIGFIHEVALLHSRQLRPIPIADGVVHMIGSCTCQNTVLSRQHTIFIEHTFEVCILIGVDTYQLHFSFRASCDGERYVHRLRIGLRCPCVCRQVLVIYIEVTTDIPIVRRRVVCLRWVIVSTTRETVVHNTLYRMNEVTGCLHQTKAIGDTIICKRSVCDSPPVGIRQGQISFLVFINFFRCTMFILGIYVTTTFARLHVNQVELDNTRHRAIHLVAILVQFLHQFQVCATGKCHHVVTAGIVTYSAV